MRSALLQRLAAVPASRIAGHRLLSPGGVAAPAAAIPAAVRAYGRLDDMRAEMGPMVPDPDAEVLYEDHVGARAAILNRPKALNALSFSQLKELSRLYEVWEHSPNVKVIIIKGAGDRAFCSGGDVRAVVLKAKEGDIRGAADFFRTEYKFNYQLATLRTPHVAFLNGITMGGGAGVSIHGPFRVATEKTMFAMPETGIGLFPDVGVCHFLSQLGALGMWLALTGTRLTGPEVYATGIATHMVPSHRLATLEERLGSLVQSSNESVQDAIDEELADPMPVPPESLLHKAEELEELFAKQSVEEIVSAVEAKANEPDGEWCKAIYERLQKVSPLSLKLTFRHMMQQVGGTLEDCLLDDLRIATRCVEDSDFQEGIRALLIDKDNNPQWKYKTLREVPEEIVERFFRPLSREEGGDLELPVEGGSRQEAQRSVSSNPRHGSRL
eukprot:jgi/Chlat1/5632/Chrsp369S05385